MKAIGSVIEAPLQALGLIPKLPKPPKPTPPITRDTAQDAVNAQTSMYGRRGSGADQLTGTGGAEAGATSKTTLG